MRVSASARRVWIFDHFSKTQLKEGESGRHESLALGLSSMGIDSVLFLSSTLHPSGDPVDFRRFPAAIRRSGRLTRVYVWSPRYNHRALQRAGNAAAYTLLSFCMGLARVVLGRGPTDIIGSTMHYGAPIVGVTLAKISGARFFFEMRDVWPDIAVDVGRWVKDSILFRMFRLVNKGLIRLSAAVISPLPNFDKYVSELGVERRFIWFPNCTSYEHNPRRTLTRATSRTVGSNTAEDLADEFLYLGSFGELYDFVGVIKAFESLLAEDPGRNLQLTFLGSGAREAELEQEIARSSFSAKIRLEPPILPSQVPARLRSSSSLILVYRDLPTLRFGISPLKFADYLAAGKPLISTNLGEPGLVAQLGIGFEVRAGDIEGLAETMEAALSLSQEELDTISARAHHHLSHELSFETSSRALIDFIADGRKDLRN